MLIFPIKDIMKIFIIYTIYIMKNLIFLIKIQYKFIHIFTYYIQFNLYNINLYIY